MPRYAIAYFMSDRHEGPLGNGRVIVEREAIRSVEDLDNIEQEINTSASSRGGLPVIRSLSPRAIILSFSRFDDPEAE